MTVSCGVSESYTWVYYIETKELEEYVERFEELSEGSIDAREAGLIVTFGDLEGAVAGICKTKDGQSPTIIIDSEYWADADEFFKENLMFHELGHCLLNRDHRNEWDDDGPVSIMNSYLIPSFYEKSRESYIEELFSYTKVMLGLTDNNKNWSCGGNHDI
jgi:hypothetical protein